jgi:hypothetical protein
MSTLTITIGIVAPVITFLIGRYFRSEATKILMDTKQEHISFWKGLYEEQREVANFLRQRIIELNEKIKIKQLQIDVSPTVQIVPNINPHHAADIEYVGIYPNNGLEPAHLTREEYQKGVDRLKDNPEDNILTNKK